MQLAWMLVLVCGAMPCMGRLVPASNVGDTSPNMTVCNSVRQLDPEQDDLHLCELCLPKVVLYSACAVTLVGLKLVDVWVPVRCG